MTKAQSANPFSSSAETRTSPPPGFPPPTEATLVVISLSLVVEATAVGARVEPFVIHVIQEQAGTVYHSRANFHSQDLS